MNFRYWSEPVDLIMPLTGRGRTITAACHACEYLVTAWPTDKYGPSYFAAAACCLKAMQNEIPQSRARDAFLLAAGDANLLGRTPKAP